jgi:multiple sugar transport system substrate-binding protein
MRHIDDDGRFTNRPSARPARRLSRAVLCCACAAGSMVLTLASTAGAEPVAASRTTAAEAPVTINYMLWDPNQEIGYKKAIANFEKVYPYVHVNVIQVGFTDYWTKLATEIAAGNPPDLFWDNLNNFPTYVSEGALLNVSPLIKKYHINLSEYYQSLLPLFVYKGQYYAITKDWDTIGLIYNKNELKKAGLAAPTNLAWNPTNGGTLLKYAEALTLDNTGKHPGQAGFNPNKIVQYGFSAGNAGGGFQTGWSNFLEEDGVTYFSHGKFSYDTPKGDQVFQFLNNLVYKWHVAPPATVTTQPTYNEATDSFSPGNVAMMTDGDWDLASIASTTKFPWGVAPLPAGPDGVVSATNGLGINIYAHSKHLPAAELLWAWLTNKATETLMSDDGYIWGSMPTVDSGYVGFWAKKGVDVSPFLTEQKGKTFLLGEAPNAQTAYTQMETELNLVFLNKVSVNSGLSTAVSEANSALGGM